VCECTHWTPPQQAPWSTAKWPLAPSLSPLGRGRHNTHTPRNRQADVQEAPEATASSVRTPTSPATAGATGGDENGEAAVVMAELPDIAQLTGFSDHPATPPPPLPVESEAFSVLSTARGQRRLFLAHIERQLPLSSFVRRMPLDSPGLCVGGVRRPDRLTAISMA